VEDPFAQAVKPPTRMAEKWAVSGMSNKDVNQFYQDLVDVAMEAEEQGITLEVSYRTALFNVINQIGCFMDLPEVKEVAGIWKQLMIHEDIRAILVQSGKIPGRWPSTIMRKIAADTCREFTCGRCQRMGHLAKDCYAAF
jgi:hypothetical protein